MINLYSCLIDIEGVWTEWQVNLSTPICLHTAEDDDLFSRKYFWEGSWTMQWSLQGQEGTNKTYMKVNQDWVLDNLTLYAFLLHSLIMRFTLSSLFSYSQLLQLPCLFLWHCLRSLWKAIQILLYFFST